MGIFQNLRSFPQRIQKHLNLVEAESLLDQFALAALLIDEGRGCVVLANNAATALTQYTRAELHQMDVPRLFPQLESAARLQELISTGTEREVVLRRRDGEFTDVIIKPGSLSPDTRWVLMTVETVSSRALKAAEREQRTKLWEAIHLLVMSTHTTDMPRAFAAALEGGEILSGGDILAVYQLLAHEPGLLAYARRDIRNILPEHVQSINMAHLRKTELWVPGKHPGSALQRIAKAGDLKYLLTMPLVDQKSELGLLVIGSTRNPPIDQLKPAAQIIAAAVASTLQKNILTTNLLDRLYIQQTSLAQGSTIESSVEEGVVVLSTNLRILDLNQAAELILGYATSEVRSQPVYNIMIGTRSLEPALRAAQNGDPTLNIGKIQLHRRNGQAFEAHVRTVPVKVNDKVERILAIFQDLSENENLRIAYQELERRALLGEVLSSFAHEANNPINNLASGLQVMAVSLDESDPMQDIVKGMNDDYKRLDFLVKGVLSYSRKTEYRLEPVDLHLMVERLFERWRPRMARENVTPLLQIEPGTPPVLGDHRALEQVFINLVTNAIQAMSEKGGTLAIKATVQDQTTNHPHLLISVSDSGPGIPEEILERIFQAFFTTKTEGTGLGLAITKRIIAAHRGKIWVESFTGGTIFYIQLPLANGHIQTEAGGTE